MLKWKSLESGYEHTGDLELWWEVNGDPISDDYTYDEISAVDLLHKWLKQSYPDPVMESMYGPGAVRIHWGIGGEATESAPFAPDVWSLEYDEHFLSFFTWPKDVETGERINFNKLPVVDKVWTPERWDKGGFIQSATGWKPSPLQPVMHVPTVLAAAGLGNLAELTQRETESLYQAAKEAI